MEEVALRILSTEILNSIENIQSVIQVPGPIWGLQSGHQTSSACGALALSGAAVGSRWSVV